MFSRGTLILSVLLAPSFASAEETQGGFTLGLTGGTNVSTPFAGLQVGRRFERASFFEINAEYTYNAPISAFAFHTLGIGAQTTFATFGPLDLYHQALLGFAVSSGGTTEVPNRELGERFLGAFMTQGVGGNLLITKQLSASLTLSTGYPVWLRPALGLHYRF